MLMYVLQAETATAGLPQEYLFAFVLYTVAECALMYVLQTKFADMAVLPCSLTCQNPSLTLM